MSDFCEQCGEPLGFILNYEFFCYNCSDYKKLDINKCLNRCETKLTNLRELFRNTIVNENIERHLYNFMNMSELTCKFHSGPDHYGLNSKIERDFVYLDIYQLVVTSIGLNWILEDLNYYLPKREFLSNIVGIYILLNMTIIRDSVKVFENNYEAADEEKYSTAWVTFPRNNIMNGLFNNALNKIMDQMISDNRIEDALKNKEH